MVGPKAAYDAQLRQEIPASGAAFGLIIAVGLFLIGIPSSGAVGCSRNPPALRALCRVLDGGSDSGTARRGGSALAGRWRSRLPLSSW